MTTKIKINRKRALELLAVAVRERGPQYTYKAVANAESNSTQTCYYVRDGKPDCGVSLALSKAGVPVETLSTFDYDPLQPDLDTGSILTVWESGHAEEKGLILTKKAARTLQDFQSTQDVGLPWGEALVNAIIGKPGDPR